jgi:pimeloyl-ACP methyl ester carboxylesterase
MRFLLSLVLPGFIVVGMTVSSNLSQAQMPPADSPVGTTSLHFKPPQFALARAFTAQVWYPATTAGKDTPVAAGRYPVLLYFPGWGSQVDDNAALLADLARAGFVAVGLSYPVGAGVPDPTVPMQFSSDSAYSAGAAQGDLMVRLEAEDGVAVLDALTKVDRADPPRHFTGHLDLQKVGTLGYSLGGCVAAETAWRDARVQAVMNLDGWMFADVAAQFFPQPYLVFRDELAPPTKAQLTSTDAFTRLFAGLRQRDAWQQAQQLAHGGGYRVTIAGSSHFSFSDHARANEKNAGPIDPRRALAIVSAYAVEFFGKELAGRPAPLLDQKENRFPEAQLEVFSHAP